MERAYVGRLSNFSDWSHIPTSISNQFDVNRLTQNEIATKQYNQNTFAAILPFTDSKNHTIYYVIETGGNDFELTFLNPLNSVLLYILANLILMFLVAFFLAKKVMQPLNLLAEFAKKNEISAVQIPENLALRKDEIGDVARALNLSLVNIRKQQDREKQFLQNASHELRSPLATIGSALHVINLRQKKGKNIDDTLLQIKRCFQQMTQLTQALLWLSKEEKSLQTSEFNVSELIEVHLSQLEHLISNKAIEVVYIRDDILIKEARALVDVVISNLIRNAFENSAGGKIILHHSTKGVSISNPIYRQKSTHIPPNQGFGLGLHLVNKVTQKQNWTLQINESDLQMDVQVCW
jgi:signal transduction histidine kinase